MGIKLAGHTQLSHRSSDVYWKTPIGYREDGRPIYPMGGGAEDDDDGDDDDADDDGDADDDADDDDDSDDGGGDDDDDLSDSEKKLLGKLDKTLDEKLGKVGQQIADRLVNAQATRDRKAARLKAQQQGGGTGAGKNGKQQDQAAPVVDHTADIREGRVAYREYVGDQITFTSSEERNAATTLATALIEKAVRDGDDPDDAGREAAESVAKTLKNLRLSIRKQTIAQLKKDGRLVEKDGDGAGSQQNRTRSSGSGRGDMSKGAAAAARLLPDRVKSTTK